MRHLGFRKFRAVRMSSMQRCRGSSTSALRWLHEGKLRVSPQQRAIQGILRLKLGYAVQMAKAFAGSACYRCSITWAVRKLLSCLGSALRKARQLGLSMIPDHASGRKGKVDDAAVRAKRRRVILSNEVIPNKQDETFQVDAARPTNPDILARQQFEAIMTDLQESFLKLWAISR